MMRSGFALCLTVALLVVASPLGGSAQAAVAPQSSAITQTFTGIGAGDLTPASQIFATVTTTGQLGQGRLYIDDVTFEATFRRSDGMELHGVTQGQHQGCDPQPNTDCRILHLDGSDDIAEAVINVTEHRGGPATGQLSRVTLLVSGTLTLTHRTGYAMVGADGTVYAFGGGRHSATRWAAFATDIELTPSRNGYWVVDALGHVFAFGDAPNLGGTTPQRGVVVTSMSATPSGKGYWLFTSKGRAIPFGDAQFFGDMHGTPLVGHIVGSIATPTGNGYYMVGSDGGVFAFGDAAFHGSTGNLRLNQPVVGLVPTTDNAGYWLVASDGGVFSFNAPFNGSMGGTQLNRPDRHHGPVRGGYLMVASDGGTFNFSTAPFFGSLAGTHLAAPITNARPQPDEQPRNHAHY